MKNILGILRLLAFFLLISWFLVRLALVRLFSRNPEHVFSLMGKWANITTSMLGIKPEYQGTVPKEGVLFLPNHRSYIDIAFFSNHAAVSFLSKVEVKKWPLIGWGARMVQTVFVDRSIAESRIQTKEAIRQRLVNGNSIVVFPEGTTTQAPTLLPLKRGMFKVAAEENLPVIPVAIEYKKVEDAWEGGEPFLVHFIKCFSKFRTYVKVDFGEAIKRSNASALHKEVTDWFSVRLGEMQREWGH